MSFFFIYSSRHFMVSDLMLKSLNYFKFIIVSSIKKRSSFILLHGYTVFPALFIEETIFSPLSLLSNISWPYMENLFVYSLFPSIGLRVYFSCQYHIALITIALQYGLKSGSVMSLALFFLRDALAIWNLLLFHTNFKIILSISVKNATRILIRIALDIHMSLSNMDILTILILLIYKHGLPFHLSVS